MKTRLALGIDLAAVELGALLLVADNLVGGVRFGEFLLRLGIVLVLVRMEFLGEPPVCLLDLVGIGGFLDAQNLYGSRIDEPTPAPARKRRGRICLLCYLGSAGLSCKSSELHDETALPPDRQAVSR